MHNDLSPVSRPSPLSAVRSPAHEDKRDEQERDDASSSPALLSLSRPQAPAIAATGTAPLSSSTSSLPARVSWHDSSSLWQEFGVEAVRNGTFLTPEKLGRDLDEFSARPEFEAHLTPIHAATPSLTLDQVRLRVLASLGGSMATKLRALADEKSHRQDVVSERSAARAEAALAVAMRAGTSAGFLHQLKTAADHADEAAGRELDLNFARYFSMNLFDMLPTQRVSRGALEIIDQAGEEMGLSWGAAGAVAAIFVIDEALAITPENWGKRPDGRDSDATNPRLSPSDPFHQPAMEFCTQLQQRLTQGRQFSDQVREMVADGADRDQARADAVRTMALEIFKESLGPVEFAKVVLLLKG